MMENRRILVVAPHADDETIGCGGTIARRIAEGWDVHVAVVTGHGDNGPHPIWPKSAWEIVRAESKQAMTVLGVPLQNLHFEDIPAAVVADEPSWKVNQVINKLVEKVLPDVLYVPFAFDLHKDHREVFHALSVAWRACTPMGRKIKAVYCYEVQSETHWNAPYIEAGFLPNTWVDVSEHIELKMQALSCYKSQIRDFPDTRSLQAMESLARWRGSQQHMSAAEAFVAIRTLD